jgi:tagaturonate epimerase
MNNTGQKELFAIKGVNIYPQSFREYQDKEFYIGKEKGIKYLFIKYLSGEDPAAINFSGEIVSSGNVYIKKCPLTTANRMEIQKLFDFTRPVVIGLNNSFGFGDRLGLANPAHLRSLSNSSFKPVLAQQSIRELNRTNRTPAEVMDAAVWAVLQEGYTEGFGADADHLKTTEDIDLMISNGFRMFTFDPGEYVHNEADVYSPEELKIALRKIDWEGLRINYNDLVGTYADREISFDLSFSMHPDEVSVIRAAVKYGDAIAHIKKLYDHMEMSYPDYQYEVEISVDETSSVTSAFEHFFIASELKRLGVEIISLAPRFVGDFEKGIDYKGDPGLFKNEYLRHVKIARYFGNYKISLHSGSDKFIVYKLIGSLNAGFTHIKTAGTSYLEALKVTAIKDTALFREILDYCRALYETEKKSYHVSADISRIAPAADYSDEKLVSFFQSDDLRQVLHVTYGRVLTDRDENGRYIFKDRLFDCLTSNEETHYDLLVKHFRKHLEPFEES